MLDYIRSAFSWYANESVVSAWPGKAALRCRVGSRRGAPPQPGPPSYLFHPKAKKYSAALPALTTTRAAGRHLIAAVTQANKARQPIALSH